MNMDNSVLLNEINENLKTLRAIGESLIARTIEQNELLAQVVKQTAPRDITIGDKIIKDIKPIGSVTGVSTTSAITKK